ncbi:MAG TPA: isoprenylcysteine carboxylmethyltransferase family protein [Streptosporangiaceae bacterium]|jgi:protein-S-isoprenylcysteine O-methyltransferase Ste14
MIVSLSLGGSIWVGLLMPKWAPALDVPAPDVVAIAGTIVIWIGLTLRIWSVIMLGGSFSTFIEVADDQAVVTRGPYRWVRHPSYTGLLLMTLAFGIAAGNWLSLVVCVVVPVLALRRRITVEESELTRVLGERYRSYQKTTDRLVPGLW